MAEEETIDDIAKGAHPAEAKKEEPKKVSTLESVVNETAHLGKNVAGYGLATSLPLALGSVAPSMQRDAMVVSTGFSLGTTFENYKKGKKTTIGDVVKESAVATLITPPLNLAYNVLNAIPNPILKGAAYLIPYQLAFIPAYLGIDYLVKKGTFKGLYKEGIKPNIKQVVKDNWLYLGIPGLLNLFFTPAYLQIPVVVGMSFLFKLITSKKSKTEIPESEKRDKIPYLAAASSVIGKGFRNSYKIISEPLYAVGSGLRDTLYKSIPKPAPMPATSPAH